MGARPKVLVSILLIVVLGIGVWQLTAPHIMPAVGRKYANSIVYSSRGTWTVHEQMSYGAFFLVFSIANVTTPQISLPSTIYSLVISNDNATVSNSFVQGFGIRIVALTVQDNYDGSSTVKGSNDLGDAIQITSNMNLKTSALHQLRFTLSYQAVDLLLVGYTNDHVTTRSFNITQIVG